MIQGVYKVLTVIYSQHHPYENPSKIFTETTHAKGCPSTTTHVESIQTSLPPRKIHYPKDSEILSSSNLPTYSSSQTHVWCFPYRPQQGIGLKDGLFHSGLVRDCSKRRGGVLFFGFTTQSNPPIMGTCQTRLRHHGFQSGQNRLSHSGKRMQTAQSSPGFS